MEDQLESLDKEEDYFADREQFEIKFYEVKANINRLLASSISGPPSQAVSTAQNSNNRSSADLTEVTLPVINIPTFRGEFSERLHF
jgi:hypothetical protein